MLGPMCVYRLNLCTLENLESFTLVPISTTEQFIIIDIFMAYRQSSSNIACTKFNLILMEKLIVETNKIVVWCMFSCVIFLQAYVSL